MIFLPDTSRSPRNHSCTTNNAFAEVLSSRRFQSVQAGRRVAFCIERRKVSRPIPRLPAGIVVEGHLLRIFVT